MMVRESKLHSLSAEYSYFNRTPNGRPVVSDDVGVEIEAHVP